MHANCSKLHNAIQCSCRCQPRISLLVGNVWKWKPRMHLYNTYTPAISINSPTALHTLPNANDKNLFLIPNAHSTYLNDFQDIKIELSQSFGRSSPAYYDSSQVVGDNEAAESSAGTLQTVPQIDSSRFSPVTFTSRVQLPQLVRADAPNKEASYSYSPFPIQSSNPHQPLHPLVLQPIIQYIIQLPPSQKSPNELEKIVEPESSNSNLSENLIEMMEEASKGEAEIGAPMTPENTSEKMPTMDNLMSIIEHMNNVSDADVLVNSQTPPAEPANPSAENDNMLMYGPPESSSERPSTNYQFVDSYGEFSPEQSDNIKSPSVDSPQGYYNSPNRNIIRDGFLKSNLRSLEPGPEETEEALTLFSHLSDQIFRDLNKETLQNDVSNRNAGGRQNSRGGRYGSNVMGNSPLYSPRQESILLDPNYGESSAYYTSYSNQRPPLDSEIYQTLQNILRNK